MLSTRALVFVGLRPLQPGVVETAVLMGAPVALDPMKWSAARSAVAGRLVSVHSRKDWLLGVMYRVGTMRMGCAGLQPVGLPGKAVQVGHQLDPALKVSGFQLLENFLKAHPFQRFAFKCQPAPLQPGVESVDATDLIETHTDYRDQLGQLLELLVLEPTP